MLGIRRPTIIEWLSSKTYEDDRGWKKNKPHKAEHSEVEASRIRTLKEKRIKEKYFVGSDYVQMDYVRQYPNELIPSTWFIDKTIREAKLQTKKPKGKKNVGGSKYLLFPAESIKNLGEIHQSADFIGKKYIAGRTEPINVFSSAYYSPFKLFQIKRVMAEKARCAIEVLKVQWQTFPIPDVFRIDNGLQFRGTASGKRSVGTFLCFLLNLSVTPLFGSPSKPWTNPAIEGHNRIFNEKIWSNNFFKNPEQIDIECNRFNQESLEYFQYKYASFLDNKQFRYLGGTIDPKSDKLVTTKNRKIYFIRFAESNEFKEPAYIDILNEKVLIPEQYTHQFVFAEWDLEKEILSIYSEFEQITTLVKQMDFKLNMV